MLPFFLIPAAAALAGFGAKKGYDGHKTKQKANEIAKKAETTYNSAISSLEKVQENLTNELTKLGEFEAQIGDSFNSFKLLAKELIGELDDKDIEAKINIPDISLSKIDTFAAGAASALKATVGGGLGAAGAGFAVWGGVMSLGAASTGTAISSLSGVAAYNATMAAIGGGAISAGGLGMAGGAAILTGVTAAPVLAAAGFAYNSYAKKSLEKSNQSLDEAKKASEKIYTIITKLTETRLYIEKIHNTLKQINDEFKKHHETLAEINHLKTLQMNEQLKELNDEIISRVAIGYNLAAIMTKIITTPIFKLKQNSKTLELATDENGINILNQDELDQSLENGITKAKEYGV